MNQTLQSEPGVSPRTGQRKCNHRNVKYHPAKSFPHPVLRPNILDYPDAEFEVTVDVKRIPQTLKIRLQADFHLTDPNILELILQDKATYTLLVTSPRTTFRASIRSKDPTISCEYVNGEIYGRMEVAPFIVARVPIRNFTSTGWHNEYGHNSFDLEPGSPLALDKPQTFHVDKAEEAPIRSILQLESRADIEDGRWVVHLEEESVFIQMSEKDYKRFNVVRSHTERTRHLASLPMNSVYLTALTTVLQIADADPTAYRDRRWFRALQARLAERQCAEMGNGNADRLADAQKLLQRPFATWLETMDHITQE